VVTDLNNQRTISHLRVKINHYQKIDRCLGQEYNRLMAKRSLYSLLHLKTLTKRLSSFGFPPDLTNRATKIQKWLTYITGDNQANPATDAEFLHDLFVDVLGYKSPFDEHSKTWELEFDPTPALGFFSSNFSQIVVEIFVGEINIQPQVKHETTEWLIITDYQDLRLYHRHKSKLFYEHFSLQSLITDPEALKQFYFIFCRRTLLAGNFDSKDLSRISKLLTESEEVEAAIATNFYNQYQKIRLQLVKDFRYRLQKLPQFQGNDMETMQSQINLEAIKKSQKLLNRILFIAFCEDNNLLPDGLLTNAYEFYNPYIQQPVWDNYKAIFKWIYKGNSNPHIASYGGELFDLDPILDDFLFVGDELCRQIKELTRFDFYEDISNSILTFILEESIKDLILLKQKQQDTRRKKPKYPSKVLLSCESLNQLIMAKINDFTNANPEDTIDGWRSRQQNLLNLKILAIQCGSGISLVVAFDCLLGEYEQVEKQIQRLEQPDNLNPINYAEITTKILQNNLYGCDRQGECVEITKLYLWLKTIQLQQPLIDLAANIQVGELGFQSIIDQTAPSDLVIIK